jgi:hypothetical protein
MRKVKELREVVAYLGRLRTLGGLQLVHEREFRRALRTLEKIDGGETIARRQLIRAISTITRILCDQLLKGHETR